MRRRRSEPYETASEKAEVRYESNSSEPYETAKKKASKQRDRTYVPNTQGARLHSRAQREGHG